MGMILRSLEGMMMREGIGQEVAVLSRRLLLD